MDSQKKQLIAITGPTAVGKTALTVNLAKALQCAIFSCDSRQFYREMNIGTAKPKYHEMQGVPHHFIDSHSIDKAITAGEYEREIIPALESYFENNSVAILTGGSGLYLDAVIHGIDDIPPVDPDIEKELEIDLGVGGIQSLQEELYQQDPEYYNQIDIFNPRRLTRALGVIRSTGKPFSSFHDKHGKTRSFRTDLHVLNREREVLYTRINQRIDAMLEAGLVDEARSLYDLKDNKVLRTVGYQELFDHFDGKLGYDTAVESIKRNSRRYAKRQLTWFKRYDQAQWHLLKDENEDKILDELILRYKA